MTERQPPQELADRAIELPKSDSIVFGGLTGLGAGATLSIVGFNKLGGSDRRSTATISANQAQVETLSPTTVKGAELILAIAACLTICSALGITAYRKLDRWAFKDSVQEDIQTLPVKREL